MPITLHREEEIQILEEIAREGSSVARIQALRRLEELRNDDDQAPEGFEGLYALNGKSDSAQAA